MKPATRRLFDALIGALGEGAQRGGRNNSVSYAKDGIEVVAFTDREMVEIRNINGDGYVTYDFDQDQMRYSADFEVAYRVSVALLRCASAGGNGPWQALGEQLFGDTKAGREVPQ